RGRGDRCGRPPWRRSGRVPRAARACRSGYPRCRAARRSHASRPPSSGLPCQSERLEPAEEDHRLPAWLPGRQRQIRQSTKDAFEDDTRLEAREPRAEAVVDPRREGEVALRLPAYVERIGIEKLSRIAVRRRHERYDHVAPTDRSIVPGHVFRRDLYGGGHRTIVAQELLHRAVEDRGIGAHEVRLLGVLEEMEEAVAEEVGRRLVPGKEEEDAVRDDFVPGQAVTLVLRA